MEEWRPILGHMYEVSSWGRVRRVGVDRFGRCSNKILRALPGGNGYLQVSPSIDGKQTRVYIHRLVAEAFLGEAPEGRPEVNHKDLNKKNNSADNLEWASREENMAHAILSGSKVGCPKGFVRSRRKCLTTECDRLVPMLGTRRCSRCYQQLRAHGVAMHIYRAESEKDLP